MKKIISALLFLASPTVLAGPFLVCDPYPLTAEQQPTEFVVTISGIANPIVTPFEVTPTGRRMHLDLGPLNLSGTRTVTVKARNMWGESASSLPLVFAAGTPVPTTGVTLSAN